MTEITNRFLVKVARYVKNENEKRVEDGFFVSPVFAISGGEARFLVYDCGNEEHSGVFRWVDFIKGHVELIED